MSVHTKQYMIYIARCIKILIKLKKNNNFFFVCDDKKSYCETRFRPMTHTQATYIFLDTFRIKYKESAKQKKSQH